MLGAVDYSSASVTRALLRVLLKSLCEWVRAGVFGREGYRQLQIDVAALHLALPFFVGAPPPAAGAGAAAAAAHDPYAGCLGLEALLNEAAVSAAERCLDPAPLEMAVVHSVASELLTSLQLAI